MSKHEAKTRREIGALFLRELLTTPGINLCAPAVVVHAWNETGSKCTRTAAIRYILLLLRFEMNDTCSHFDEYPLLAAQPQPRGLTTQGKVHQDTINSNKHFPNKYPHFLLPLGFAASSLSFVLFMGTHRVRSTLTLATLVESIQDYRQRGSPVPLATDDQFQTTVTKEGTTRIKNKTKSKTYVEKCIRFTAENLLKESSEQLEHLHKNDLQ